MDWVPEPGERALDVAWGWTETLARCRAGESRERGWCAGDTRARCFYVLSSESVAACCVIVEALGMRFASIFAAAGPRKDFVCVIRIKHPAAEHCGRRG